MPRDHEPTTACLLKVHPSNFRNRRIYASRPAWPNLATLGGRALLPVIEDLGSGALIDTGRYRSGR